MAFNAGAFALQIELLGPGTSGIPSYTDANFQVTEANVTPAFWAVVKADGGDIRASTDAAGANELAIHVQHIDTVEQTLNLRVNFTSYTEAARTLFLSVGNASANLYAITDPFGTRAVYPRHQFMYHFDEPEFSTTAVNHATQYQGTYVAPWKNQGVARDTVLGTDYDPAANGNLPAGILRPNIPIGTYDQTGNKEYVMRIVLDHDNIIGGLATIMRFDTNGFMTIFKNGPTYSLRVNFNSGSTGVIYTGAQIFSKQVLHIFSSSDNNLCRLFINGVEREVFSVSGDITGDFLTEMTIGGSDGTGDWPNYDASMYETSFELGSTRTAERTSFFNRDAQNLQTPETFWTLQAEVAATSYVVNATIAEIPDGTYPTVVIDPVAQTVLFNGDVTWSGTNAVIGFNNAAETLPIDVEYYVYSNYHGAVGVGTANPL